MEYNLWQITQAKTRMLLTIMSKKVFGRATIAIRKSENSARIKSSIRPQL